MSFWQSFKSGFGQESGRTAAMFMRYALVTMLVIGGGYWAYAKVYNALPHPIAATKEAGGKLIDGTKDLASKTGTYVSDKYRGAKEWTGDKYEGAKETGSRWWTNVKSWRPWEKKDEPPLEEKQVKKE